MSAAEPKVQTAGEIGEEEEEEEFCAPEDTQHEGDEEEYEEADEGEEDEAADGEEASDDQQEEEEDEEQGASDAEREAGAAAAANAIVKQQQQHQEQQAAEAKAAEAAEGAATAAPRDTSASSPAASATASPAPAAHAAADSAPSAAAGEAMDLKQLEAQASKVAHDVQNAALQMSNQLTASFKSALGGLGSTEPPTLSKLAGGLASWWSSLDPPAQPKRDETAERVQASAKATSELQELFGLLPEENLVESFKCKLLQTYGCSHNSFTPAIQMAFQGTMYITDKHTCFSVEERNRKLPFKIPHTQIAKAERHRPQRKGDLSDILRIELRPAAAPAGEAQQFLAFKDFDSGSALDSALALVEHLMDG